MVSPRTPVNFCTTSHAAPASSSSRTSVTPIVDRALAEERTSCVSSPAPGRLLALREDFDSSENELEDGDGEKDAEEDDKDDNEIIEEDDTVETSLTPPTLRIPGAQQHRQARGPPAAQHSQHSGSNKKVAWEKSSSRALDSLAGPSANVYINNVYNLYSLSSSRENIGQKITAGRMKGPKDFSFSKDSRGSSADRDEGGIQITDEDMLDRDLSSLTSGVLGSDGTDFEWCARLLKVTGQWAGPTMDRHNFQFPPASNLDQLSTMVDQNALSVFMRESHDVSNPQHALLQYAIHHWNLLESGRASTLTGPIQFPARLLGPSASRDPTLDVEPGSTVGQEASPIHPFPHRTSSSTQGGLDGADAENSLSSKANPGPRLANFRKRKPASSSIRPVQASFSQSAQAETPTDRNSRQALNHKRRRAESTPQSTISLPSASGVGQARDHPEDLSGVAQWRTEDSAHLHRHVRVFAPSSGLPASVSDPTEQDQDEDDPGEDGHAQDFMLSEVFRQLPGNVRQRLYNQLGCPTAPPSTSTRPLQFFAVASPLPNIEFVMTSNLFFASELLPRSFDHEKRCQILRILRTKAPYVPACISQIPNRPKIQYNVILIEPSNAENCVPCPLGPSGEGWPSNTVPLEVFQLIAKMLSRDDLQQMRLVNREFEKSVSNILFRNAVVPFRDAIYGMIAHAGKAKRVLDVKGKGKAKGKIISRSGLEALGNPIHLEVLFEQDLAAKEAQDGMAVFQAWGPHVKNFAMAFEVDEDQLSKPPKKSNYETIDTFWGPYKWPHPFYNRYDICAAIEKKADEFCCMSLALSNLQGTLELGLSIDSGLGWLAGPDVSDRARLFQEKAEIFGMTHKHPDSSAIERKKTWEDIIRSFGTDGWDRYSMDGETVRDNQESAHPPIRNEFGFYEAVIRYEPPSRPYLRYMTRVGLGPPPGPPLVFEGVDVSKSTALVSNPTTILDVSGGSKEHSTFKSALLVPNALTTPQKEWLLETEWAQRAFLSSYCMAFVDNSSAFQNVRHLVIAQLSSRYLSTLQREDFWKALPGLNNLTVKVSADFREVIKADSGVVEARNIEPSRAASQFHALLKTCIADVSNIKTLTIGYCGGGERQGGIFGRNRHILPAPLNDFTCHQPRSTMDQRGVLTTKILILPHVQHFTLINCWIAPPTLERFVGKMAVRGMRTLTLESVSLTAHTGVTDPEEPSPLANGVSPVADGPPRTFDPKLGNLWVSRGAAPHPNILVNPNSWIITGGRVGSWRNVIDAITPGPSIDLLRYAFQFRDKMPTQHSLASLERINFVSCGYVQLPHQPGLEQWADQALGPDQRSPYQPTVVPPTYLQRRTMDLLPVMMHRNDDLLLGSIIPYISPEELDVFNSCFPMTVGWGNDESRFENLEDGQPIGGTGRFTGHVERLVYA